MIQIVLLRPTKNGASLTHCHPIGFPQGIGVANTDALFKNLPEIKDKLLKAHSDNLRNAYFTVGHHTGLNGPMPSRTKMTFEYQSVLQFDIDYIDNNRQWDYLPILSRVLGVLPQNFIFTATGNGLHFMLHLATPIRSCKYIDETRPHYNEICYKINQALKEASLPGQADPAVWSAERILRLPGSINDKKGVTKPCVLLQDPGFVQLELDVIKLSGLDKIAIENVTAAQIKKNYPRPDFPTVMSQCEFLKWIAEYPEQVHEPQYMALLGILAAMSPGDKVPYKGKELLAKEFAEEVFNAASNSKSLQGGNFEQKWEHGIRYGAPKCQTVSNSWLTPGCQTCPHFNKINTPLALKSEEHISSSANGYWVMGTKGPLHPHYSDLTKIYRKEHSYFSCEPDRLFIFDNTHYRETGPLTVKSWLENKVGYEELTREAHRTEFLKKILVSGSLPKQAVDNLFIKSIRGKLNCRNGVVDILTGSLEPHNSLLGFQYVLPYNFEPDLVSEFFVDWLTEIMMNRTDLMEAVLDMMAYCLWPNYDSHVFCYFIGEGRNGKSTLLHLMQELLGADNYSTVSIQQLAANRFSPASLEGKLANLSEESSGSDLSYEECNAVKTLSAGGGMEVERKGQQQFKFTNQAKLIFSANHIPRFREHGKALKDRLLVVPFDFTIQNSDSRVEKQLLQEVPKICSMLVKRIQQNILANGGRFVVSRGGQAAEQAQEKVLLSGNSVGEWAKECLESSVSLGEDKYIVASDAFPRYTAWCGLNNYKATNSHTFGYMMTHGALGTAVTQTGVRRIGGKPKRVYPYTQWRDE